MADGQEAMPVAGSAAQVPQVTWLKDYQVPDFFIDTTDLRFELDAAATRVTAQLRLRRNGDHSRELRLDGEQQKLLSIAIDGRELDPNEYQLMEDALQLAVPGDGCLLELVTEIDPAANLALEGLYMSDGMYCTQCEAEGFRRITYYLDRPDVMSEFTTEIVADAKQFPVLLSNGNPVGAGQLDDGRHWVRWRDPFKKPCYLFALVAGDLHCQRSTFTTCSGREIALEIYVEPRDLDKVDHAMDSLQRAMRWDEQRYGREYDLDLYMIVAVDFFNMGAMENKGLNIFNTSCVLAHPRTQTDQAFQRVEAVIAHEYFHNWSGNRVTCRDWFQLSLKEGFTVFRDASFSADMNSPTVKRVEDVNLLRSAQFAEDAGPMAHAVRPESYQEISNFYTLTIYEKGAEVIRMQHELLGAAAFRKACDLYFSRHDGQAVTCEDFVTAMEDSSGVDLGQFRRWYEQAGTPHLAVSDAWDAGQGTYTLRVAQSCAPTPGQPEKKPFYIPLRVALTGADGSAVKLPEGARAIAGDNPTECMLIASEPVQQWQFTGLQTRPTPSLLRGFSAPVTLSYDYSDAQLATLMCDDDDGFVRWDASQQLALAIISRQVADQGYLDSDDGQAALDVLTSSWDSLLAAGLGEYSWREEHDAAMLAEITRLPNYAYLLEQFEPVEVTAIVAARKRLEAGICQALGQRFLAVYVQLAAQLAAMGAYRPVADDIALRSLKNHALAILLGSACSAVDREQVVALASEQFAHADNMTDQYSALAALVNSPFAEAESAASAALDKFYDQWQGEALVVNQWLSVQASSQREGAIDRVRALMQHPAYDADNPNKVRALLGGFCVRNVAQFHDANGSGYALLADEVIRLNKTNPQLASRLLTPLTQWRRYAEAPARLMQAALERIRDSGSLSSDVLEVVSKTLEGAVNE